MVQPLGQLFPSGVGRVTDSPILPAAMSAKRKSASAWGAIWGAAGVLGLGNSLGDLGNFLLRWNGVLFHLDCGEHELHNLSNLSSMSNLSNANYASASEAWTGAAH